MSRTRSRVQSLIAPGRILVDATPGINDLPRHGFIWTLFYEHLCSLSGNHTRISVSVRVPTEDVTPISVTAIAIGRTCSLLVHWRKHLTVVTQSVGGVIIDRRRTDSES